VFAPMLNLAGASSLGAFEKDAVCCGLEVEDGQLTSFPTENADGIRDMSQLCPKWSN